MKHDILDIVVVENWIKQETVLVLTDSIDLRTACLIEEGLASCRSTKV